MRTYYNRLADWIKAAEGRGYYLAMGTTEHYALTDLEGSTRGHWVNGNGWLEGVQR